MNILAATLIIFGECIHGDPFVRTYRATELTDGTPITPLSAVEWEKSLIDDALAAPEIAVFTTVMEIVSERGAEYIVK